MTKKVKRGLGLVVLAVVIAIAAAILSALTTSDGGADNGVWPVGMLVACCSLFAGLCLLAWGLLRD